MDQILDQLKTFYAGLDAGRRKALWAAVAGSLIVVTGVGIWAGQGSYKTVVASGSVDEMNSAAAALGNAGIEVRYDGEAIQVPTASYGQAQYVIAEAGQYPTLDIPPSWSPAQFGLYEQARREFDIEAGLNSFEMVENSQVTLVSAGEESWLQDARPARASVILKLRPGADLNSTQVRVMTNMVANSVVGLDSNHITITDTRGTELHVGDGEASGARVGNELLELQSQRAALIEKQVLKALVPVVGAPNDLAVSVAIELEESSEARRTRTVAPEGTVLSVQSKEQTSQDAGVGGAPGSTSNSAEGPALGDAGGQSSDSNAMVENYDVGDEVVEVQRAAGTLKRMTLAVSVDTAAYTGEDIEAWTASLEQAAMNAAGFDATRGDTITVQALPFAQVSLAEPTGLPVAIGAWGDLVGYAVAALALVLFFLMVVRPLMKLLTAPPAPVLADGTVDADGEGEEKESDDLADRLRLLVENYEAVDAEDLNRLVERESDAAAQVIRMWSRG